MEKKDEKVKDEAPVVVKRRRKFATSKNSGEALGTFPTLEKLTDGYNLLKKGEDGYEVMSRAEVIKKGTPMQKLRLYFSNIDMTRYFNTESDMLTPEEKAALIASTRKELGVPFIKECLTEYKKIQDYGTHLRASFKVLQVSFAFLAELLHKWNSYEELAKEYTMTYRNVTERLRSSGCGEFAIKVAQNAIIDTATEKNLDGAKLIFEEGFRKFKLNVDGKGGLYERIKEEAKSVRKDLEGFKAVALVAEEYIGETKTKYMPISIQVCIENAEEERYMRYLVKDTSFFRSELNDRKARGELITPRDEKRAVIADYYEVKPNKIRYNDAKGSLKEQ